MSIFKDFTEIKGDEYHLRAMEEPTRSMMVDLEVVKDSARALADSQATILKLTAENERLNAEMLGHERHCVCKGYRHHKEMMNIERKS